MSYNYDWDEILDVYVKRIAAPDGRDTFESTTELVSDIIKIAEFKSSDTLIDIGSGWGNTAIPLSQKVSHITGIEPDKKNIGEVLKSGNGAERARPFETLPDRIKKACETLGVKAGADESEIRSAYRKKLKLFHPDSNAENETVQRVAHKKTEEIVEAYKAILAYKDSSR